MKKAGAEMEALPMRASSAGRQLMTLAEQIAERISLSIATGDYAPGDRIREEAIAEQLEVSRGPVREALRILERDAVVRIQPHRGAHVTRCTTGVRAGRGGSAACLDGNSIVTIKDQKTYLM